MNLFSRHHIILHALGVLILSLALVLPAPVLAEEPVPPTDTPASPAEPTEELPAADLTETVALLDETGSILTDEDGEAIPLASVEAFEMLTDPDPFIVRGGTTYAFTAADCDPVTANEQPCTNPVQAAINFALPGETINIEPGIYNEQLEIDKDLTLQATAPGVTIKSPSGTLPIKFVTPCWGTTCNNFPVIYVHDTSNVTLSGLIVDGNGNGNVNYRFDGVAYVNAGGTIDGNSVLNIEDTPFSGMQAGVGIYAYNLDGTPRTLTITDNLVDDFQKTGIAVSGDGLTVLIDGNTVIGAGPTTVTAQNGIQVGYGTTGTISNNTVSGIDYAPATWTATGILLYDPGDGMVVTGNDVQDAQTGIYAYQSDDAVISDNTVDGSSWGIYVDTSDNVELTGNTVTDSDGDGIDLYDVTNLSLDGNIIDTSSYDGIWIGGASSDISITNNIITGNGNGVSDPQAGGIHVVENTHAPSLLISGNTFIGNKSGVSNSLIESVIEAYGNYWGCPDGPASADCDPVYRMVLYDPFLSFDPNVPEPTSASNLQTVRPSYQIVPVTGGELFDIPCDSPVAVVNFLGTHQVHFKGLCGYQAIIEEVPAETLPDALPAGETYTSGLSVTLFKDGMLVDVLPRGTSIVILYRLPQTDTTYSMLYWDDQANENLGAWYTLPPKQEDITQPIALYPDNLADQRLVIIGTWIRPESEYLEIEVNFSGTYLLVTP